MIPHSARTVRAFVGVSAAAFVIALTACGSTAPAGDKVASLGTQAPVTTTAGTGSATDSSTPSKPGNPQLAFADFAKCMRGEGIDMPDPKANGSNSQVIVIDGGAGAGFDPNSDDFKAADKKCKPILDSAGGQIKVDPAVLAEQRKQMLAYAKCMRDHGVDIPDPTFGDGGGSVSVSADSVPAGAALDSEAFKAANTACGKLLGATGPITPVQVGGS